MRIDENCKIATIKISDTELGVCRVQAVQNAQVDVGFVAVRVAATVVHDIVLANRPVVEGIAGTAASVCVPLGLVTAHARRQARTHSNHSTDLDLTIVATPHQKNRTKHQYNILLEQTSRVIEC
jgi:hypothetical protein